MRQHRAMDSHEDEKPALGAGYREGEIRQDTPLSQSFQ